MWFEWKAVACKVCHCLHRVHKTESDLWVLKCHCCGESLDGCTIEELHEPKGGYNLFMVDRRAEVKPLPVGGTVTRKGAIQIIIDWWGKEVDLFKVLNQLDEEGIIYNDSHTFALKRVAD